MPPHSDCAVRRINSLKMDANQSIVCCDLIKIQVLRLRQALVQVLCTLLT